MTHVKITRTHRFSESLGGELYVDGRFICNTLELPWRWNQKNISCIPSGTYTCFWRYDRGRIQVENIFCLGITRVEVQIHAGNIPKHSKGCILVGTSLHPNRVLHSKNAMSLLERAIWGAEVGPGYVSKPITLSIEGVLMSSDFDNLDGPPIVLGHAIA
jgi:hypothetical protein